MERFLHCYSWYKYCGLELLIVVGDLILTIGFMLYFLLLERGNPEMNLLSSVLLTTSILSSQSKRHFSPSVANRF